MEGLEPRRLLASPEIDLTFGEGGVARGGDQSIDTLYVITELANGKILTAGGLLSGPPVVMRFNADGSPDTSFDGDGTLAAEQDDETFGYHAALAPDGKIVITTHDREPVLRFYRFNADGTRDTSFGANGRAAQSFNDVQLVSSGAVEVQEDGKIIFAYAVQRSLDVTDHYLGRLNVDGSNDASFRGGFASPQELEVFGVDDLLIGPDGKIYLSGAILAPEGEPSYNAGVVQRFNSNGTIDTSFGQGGTTRLIDVAGAAVIDGAVDAPTAGRIRIALDSAGRIVAASDIWQSNHPTRIELIRLTSAGARDTTFGGGDGSVELGVFENGTEPTRPLIGADGKITVGAALYYGSQLKLFRVTPDGTLDDTFGENGKFEPRRDVLEASALAFDQNGDLLVAGATSNPYFLTVTRVVADSPDVTLNSAGHLFVAGSDGSDRITFEHAADQLIVHRNGVDSAFPFASVNLFTAFPGEGDDVITVPFALDCSIGGSAGNDSINLSDGDMTINGGDGDDSVVCGAGDHTVALGEGDNMLLVGAGEDSITAGDGNDTIVTGDGDDSIDSEDGDDSITCGGGDDTIYAGHGFDTVHAGDGNDIVQPNEIDPNEGPDIPPGPVTGPSYFSAGGKTYYGEGGDDTISGGVDGDTLLGGDGRDFLMGGAGRDLILGGANPDYISGGGGNDKLAGGGGSDRIHGGFGNDRLDGGRGNDHLFGEYGDDALADTKGHNILDGSIGNDSAIARRVDQLIEIETT
jgi:uncharacterized delta-60 repeat protein